MESREAKNILKKLLISVHSVFKNKRYLMPIDKTNMNSVYLLIGGNMGDRMDYLQRAKEAIGKNTGTILKASAIYETEAWGLTNQEKFLNQAVMIDSQLKPKDLLHSLLQIEEQLGRKRDLRYGPRIIDIDILFYGDEIVHEPHLEIPHPEVQNRRFALQCLDDIAPNFIHPLLHKTIAQLLFECSDPLKVNKFN
jgi:2-amino-4-hydroxy-6-hydroxymethyldihydropteridine diphosphokinase